MISRQVIKAELVKLKPHPLWARKEVEEAVKQAMGESLVRDGQKVPILIYGNLIVDGNCRVEGARFKGFTNLDAIEFDHEPSKSEVLRTQASIDLHRNNLTPIERADLLGQIREQEGWSVSRLAEEVSISQAMCSKLLALRGLPPEGQKLVQDRVIDIERGARLAKVTDPATQRVLMEQAGTLSREAFRKKARGEVSKAGEKACSARFAMPGQVAVSMSAKDLTLTLAVEIVAELARMLKRGLAEGLDIRTQQKVMADRARPKKAIGTNNGEKGQVQS